MRNRLTPTVTQIATAAVIASFSGPVAGQTTPPTYNTFGTTGLLEMPTAESAPAGELAATLSYSDSGGYKTTLTFQLLDRLSGSFRYSIFDLYRSVNVANGTARISETYDRSFDVEYKLLDETRYIPSVAVGLRDFLGTGRFSSEYIVGTKSIGSNLKVTAGLGFGRMGQRSGVSNPLGGSFEDRDEVDVFDEETGRNTGGQLSVGNWFRGDMAAFAGLEYSVTPTLSFKAEYSSIDYPQRQAQPVVNPDSPFNFGLNYQVRPGVQLGANYMYGKEIGVQATFMLNPNDRPTYSGFETSPVPIKPRTPAQLASSGWNDAAAPQLREALQTLLEAEDIDLVGVQLTDLAARVRYQNNKYRSETQAIGRVSRIMTQVLPPSIETFILEPERAGVALSSVVIQRTDLEERENTVGATDAIFDAIEIRPAGKSDNLTFVDGSQPRFEYGIGPYFDFTLFTPGNPVAPDFGLKFDAQYNFSRNFYIAGSTSISAQGAREPLSDYRDNNDYVNVRTDKVYFGLDGGLQLDRLYLSYYDRIMPEVFGRVTAGYLETMYGGVSGEVLYAPVEKQWALGAELNYAVLRDQDMGFDFALYETTADLERVEVGDYDVVTGHLTGYYDFDNGYLAQVDVGRYLAGDVGASFGLSREFNNGWVVGGYFTLTDMPFNEFGEGSFDKGVRLVIPADYFTGTSTRNRITTGFRSLSRDGGARLNVPDRLYGRVSAGQLQNLEETSGRFWR